MADPIRQSQQRPSQNPWQNLAGPNLGYAAELYERYRTNPESIDAATRELFETWGPPPTETSAVQATSAGAAGISEEDIRRILNAQRMVRNIREYGHMEAHINPLQTPERVPLLDLQAVGLTEADLAAMPARWVWPDAPANIQTAAEAITRLRAIYTGTLAFDIAHVHDVGERAWLTHQAEIVLPTTSQSKEEQKNCLKRLIEVDEFERFLHKTFVGQKRFSIEGVDMLVPMLDELVRVAAEHGAKDVMLGMAHRGRLNVLAHVLGKPYANIFSEFHAAPNKDLVPSEGSMGINYGWTGDVKYHLGASRTVQEGEVVSVRVTLANNPSHLEFVDPVVEGFARAAQDNRNKSGKPTQDVDTAIAVLIHGDAAFPGEGIVAETLNLSSLSAYQTGGTIHIIANNQLGFTAEPQEGRSTRYASDLAKGFEIPIVHVSADDPDACLAAITLAHAYRQKYHKDFLIDLIGYRKWGHNEMDDPTMTQPTMYANINAHGNVREVYAKKLEQTGVVNAEERKQIEESVLNQLQKAYQDVKDGGHKQEVPELPELPQEGPPDTAVPIETLRAINDELLTYPEGFTVYSKLDRILQRRKAVFNGDGKVDWAHAEALAFATILADGTPIRMTGQDSERGTFGHRHLVLHDHQTGQRYSPMHGLSQAKASFDIANSALSEGAIIGFEYGYNVQAPEVLVLWEGQFGDFANAGQVLIDQFLSSGRAKWAQDSSLVMLLPHGYEGQGPEHSSARLERYLQMCAEDNWRIVNVSSAAQYFHLLRAQARRLLEAPRPLIVMSPKSLLRNPRAGSDIGELTSGRFQQVLVDPLTKDHTTDVHRLVLCSGKVSIDLAAAMDTAGKVPEWLAVARVEQLYPYPTEAVSQVLSRYPNLKEVVWLQEEPQNMGTWVFMAPRTRKLLPEGVKLRYVGRPERSSPAEGIADAHEAAQRQIIDMVLNAEVPKVASAAGRNSK